MNPSPAENQVEAKHIVSRNGLEAIELFSISYREPQGTVDPLKTDQLIRKYSTGFVT